MIDGKELHNGELVQSYANIDDFNRFKRLLVMALKASGYKIMMDCHFDDSNYFITFSKLNKSIRYELIKS
jgi:hypothetical protein